MKKLKNQRGIVDTESLMKMISTIACTICIGLFWRVVSYGEDIAVLKSGFTSMQKAMKHVVFKVDHPGHQDPNWELDE